MYIISKFKDYYDGAVGMGIDKTIVYGRTTTETEYETVEDLKLIKTLHHRSQFEYRAPYKLSFPNFHTNSKSIYDSVDTFIIGFCGKYYLGFKFTKKILDRWGYDTHDTETYITYNADEVKKELSFENRYSWKKGDTIQQT